MFTIGVLWLLAMTCLHNTEGAFKSKYWKLHNLINLNCNQTKTSKCVLGNNYAEGIGILVLMFLLMHCTQGSAPSLREMLSWDGFGFEPAWPGVSFYIFVSTFCDSWINKVIPAALQTKATRITSKLIFGSLAKCNWLRTEWPPPCQFWAQMISLLVLLVTAEKWWLLL